MEPDDLLDQQSKPRKKFNKAPLLYGLVSICFFGFVMQRMLWPGYSLFIIFGGGLSVGYVAALLTHFTSHYLFENVGFFLYSSFVTFSVIDNFAPIGWQMYFGTLVASFLLFFLFLREKEIF